MSNRIDSVTIVGGGTAGWLMATFLATTLNRGKSGQGVRVSLIESPRIPTVGVGESTVPGMYKMMRDLGINESEFFARCNATFKCAGRFHNWNVDSKGKPLTFINPFNTGPSIGGYNAAYYYHKFGGPGGASFTECTLPTELLVREAKGPRPLGGKDYENALPYSYHLDAKYFAEVLRDVAVARGVEHIRDDVLEVELDERGYIATLNLEQKGRVPVDFVVDCTGFKGMILQQVLKEPFMSYDKSLLCDRAIPLQMPHRNPKRIEPVSASNALSSGWSWRVPLYTRVGAGYVFSSHFLSDDEAIDELLKSLGNEVQGEVDPKVIRMRVGRVRRVWVKNCIAAGLAAGFLEPLEATAIFSIEMTARLFLDYFPDRDINERLADRFNQVIGRMYDGILDFIIMLYYTSNRTDSPFWLAARNDIEVPDALRENLELWKTTLPTRYDTEGSLLFNYWDYLYVLLGKRYFDGVEFPGEASLVKQDWTRFTQKIMGAKASFIRQMPSHYDLLTEIRSRGAAHAEPDYSSLLMPDRAGRRP